MLAMTQITAQMVKSLRDRTGAGMMDCKNALKEVGGDEDKAVELIQKNDDGSIKLAAGAEGRELKLDLSSKDLGEQEQPAPE